MSRNLMKEIVTVAVVAILIFAFFEYAASPTIEGGLANLSSNENAVQAPWENHLTEVIDYFNTYVQDNYTIITAYALHLAYFTGHPVIEMFYYDGEMDIIKLNETVTNDYVGLLTAQDVHYLLLPKPSNSMYANYLTLSKELPILNINFISSQPGVILLRNFTDFLLYRLVPKQEQSQSFAYLSNFTDGWVPIGNSTFMSFGHSPSSVIIQGTTTLPILGIGNQGGFWQTAKSNVSDRISVSENSQFGVNGSNSLQIAVNGTGNMVISHTYTKPQDFSGLGIVSFLLHGADSNRQIDFTFHTIEWEDYYTYYINDNFTGWRSFSISERSFTPEGSPSWGSISYIEIRFPDRVATYYLNGLQLVGQEIGISKILPTLPIGATNPELILYVDHYPPESYPTLQIVDSNGTSFSIALNLGLNTVLLPSYVSPSDAVITISLLRAANDSKMSVSYLEIYELPAQP